MRKPGPDIHMLNRTVYTVSITGSTLTRSAVDDPSDVTATQLDFAPSSLAPDTATKTVYLTDSDRRAIYRMPLAFDTENSKCCDVRYQPRGCLNRRCVLLHTASPLLVDCINFNSQLRVLVHRCLLVVLVKWALSPSRDEIV